MNDIPADDQEHLNQVPPDLEYPDQDFQDREEYPPQFDEQPNYAEMSTPPPIAMAKSGGKSAITRRSAWSNEAEQSILGAILLDNDVMDQVADIVVPEDFYMGAHRAIYQGMVAVLERGDPADPILVSQYLEKILRLNPLAAVDT